MEIKTRPSIYNHSFSETGMADDAGNAGWFTNSLLSQINQFEKLTPIKHYMEYFQEQDRKYQESGRSGLLSEIEERSNPDAVLAFDALVDDFNLHLEQIKQERNGEKMDDYLKKFISLKKTLEK